MKRFLAVVLIAWPSPAAALCIQSSGWDLASSVDGALDYLICLHNDQVRDLNEHAAVIDDQRRLIGRLEDRIDMLELQLSSLQVLVMAMDP